MTEELEATSGLGFHFLGGGLHGFKHHKQVVSRYQLIVSATYEQQNSS